MPHNSIGAASIQFGAEQFVAATGQAEGIPKHAIQIEGKLIHLETKNLAEWGVTESATEQILKGIEGIPIRACKSLDPHECDFAFDNQSHIGYGVRAWLEDDWIHAAAAITDAGAIKLIEEGTWTPFGKGNWSVAGIPTETGADFETTGLISGYQPTGISIVFSPAIPAFVGSGFDMVAAAVKNTTRKAWKVLWAGGRAVQFFEDEKDADYFIASGKGKAWFEFVSKTLSEMSWYMKSGRSYIVHPSGTKIDLKPMATAAETISNHRGDILTENTPDDGRQDPVTYTQDDLDTKIKEALENQKTKSDAEAKKLADAELAKQKTSSTEELAKQKLEYDAALEKLSIDDRAAFDAKLAEMTPTADVEKMIAAAVSQGQAETLETIEKDKLLTEYGGMLAASVVLGAPYHTDGALDPVKVETKLATMKGMHVAAISGIVTEAKMMVAAATPAQSAFDAAAVTGTAPGTDAQETQDLASVDELREATGRI